MKKVKLKLKYDELHALQSFIVAHAHQVPAGLPKTFKWQWRMIQALVIAWAIKIQARIVFKQAKPYSITLDAPTACAFMLYFGWTDANNYLEFVVQRIQAVIDQAYAS
jgi:hypothetical protein